MPQIPTYQSKELPSASPGGVEIPIGMAQHGPEAAMEQAGEVLSNIGQVWHDKVQKAQQADQLSWGMAEHSRQQNALYNQTQVDPNYIADPASGFKKYQDEAQNLSASIAGQITDPAARRHFTNLARTEITHYINAMSDAQRKTTIDKLKAAGAGNLDTFRNAVVTAPTDEIALDALKRAGGIRDSLYAGGVISLSEWQKQKSTYADEALKQRALREMQSNPQSLELRLSDSNSIYSWMSEAAKTELRGHARVASEHVNGRQVQAMEDYADKYATSKFGLNLPTAQQEDFIKASEWIDNPLNQDIQLPTVQSRNLVAANLRARGEERRKQVENNQKASYDACLDQAMQGKVSIQNLLSWRDPKTGLRPTADQLEKIQKYLANPPRSMHSDPNTLENLRVGVTNRQILDTEPLNDAFAEGRITEGDYKWLINLQTKQADLTKTHWFSWAEMAYKTKYADSQGNVSPEAMKLYPQFILSLDTAIKKNNLTGNEIQEYADKMLSDIDKQLIPGWFSWGKGTALEYAESWGKWPEPEANKRRPETPSRAMPQKETVIPKTPVAQPAPGTPAKSSELKPYEQMSKQEKFAHDYLKRSKAKLTPANIDYVIKEFGKKDPEFHLKYKIKED